LHCNKLRQLQELNLHLCALQQRIKPGEAELDDFDINQSLTAQHCASKRLRSV
jgi:hypothetical protein